MDSYSFSRFLLNFQLPNEMRYSQCKLKSSEIVKCQLVTCSEKNNSKLHVPKNVIPTVPKKELFIVLPYLGTLSSNLKQN